MSPTKTEEIIKKIMNFLRLFMSETLVKRIVSMLLLSVGVENSRVTELTGLCARSVHSLKKELGKGEIDNLFKVGGGGRKRKLENIEEAIIAEIEKNDYHSHQQIADMIQEKHGIKVSLKSVERLLKKTKSNG
jgi:transposase